MTDRELLLEAIFLAPNDDAPRLIYADWLDEHGEPAQAEFIRFRCAMARIDLTDREYEPYAENLKQVWDRFATELSDICDSDAQLIASDFPRGLPDSPIHFSVAYLRDHSAKWWPRLPIRAISTDLGPWNVDDFVAISYLSRIRVLVIVGEDPHGHIMSRLSKCRQLRSLQILDLRQLTMGLEAVESLANSPVFDQLTELRAPYSMRPNRDAARMLRKRFGEVCQF